MTSTETRIRCGIVLAAGEGRRLQPFVRKFRRDLLPKQYLKVVGTRSMLEHTFDRVEKLIPRPRVFTVISKDHLSYSEVREQLSGRQLGTTIVQPINKETAPGILLPLMHLCKRYPDSTAAVFPSDHFIINEDFFMAHVDLAFRAVERAPASIVLLGVQPDQPEPEYGYILPEETNRAALPGVRKVLQFVEKPAAPVAQELALCGGLWNTLVTVFKVKTLMKVVRRTAPALYTSFKRIYKAIETPDERAVVEEAYKSIEPLNFSSGLLQTLPLSSSVCLSVLAVEGVFWSDVGSERRLLSAIGRIGHPDKQNSGTKILAWEEPG